MGPANVMLDGADVEVFTSDKSKKVEPLFTVLLLNCMRGVRPVLASFPLSARKTNEDPLAVVNVLSVAVSSGPARDTVLGRAAERSTVRKFPPALNVLALKFTNAFVPLLFKLEPSRTMRNEFLFAGVPEVSWPPVALTNGPATLTVAGVVPDVKKKLLAVATVLSLN
jgi:hypothetical protein